MVAGLIVPAVLALHQGGRVRATLGSRVAVFMGSISYGFYLWHWAIIRWLAKHWFYASSGQTMLKVTLVGLPATIAIAYASFRIVEKPLIKLSKRVR
jgi:peptidoglycan/LPS O-acetylase OafA/YrhL